MSTALWVLRLACSYYLPVVLQELFPLLTTPGCNFPSLLVITDSGKSPLIFFSLALGQKSPSRGFQSLISPITEH